MVKLRLRRAGAKKKPFYHIVAAEDRWPRDGRFIEKLGYYDPSGEPPIVKIDLKKYESWVLRGAVPTPAVIKLFKLIKPTEEKSQENPSLNQSGGGR